MKVIKNYNQKMKTGYVKMSVSKLINRVIILIIITALFTEVIAKPGVFGLGYNKAFAKETNKEQDTSMDQVTTVESEPEVTGPKSAEVREDGIISSKGLVTEGLLDSKHVSGTDVVSVEINGSEKLKGPELLNKSVNGTIEDSGNIYHEEDGFDSVAMYRDADLPVDGNDLLSVVSNTTDDDSVPEVPPIIGSESDTEQVSISDNTSDSNAAINEVTPEPKTTDGTEEPEPSEPEITDGTEEPESSEPEESETVEGVDELEKSIPEETPIMEIDTEAPSAPVNLVATVTGSAIVLSWEPSSDNIEVIGYDIYQDEVLIGFAESNFYIVPEAAIGVSYLYSVRAKDEAGNASEAAEIIFTMPSAEKPSITMAKVGETEVSLEWTPIIWATGYEISINGEITDIGNLTTYVHTSVLPNTTYEYRIRALSGSYIGEWSDSISVLTAPGRVTNLTSKVIDSKTIKLSWDAVEGALFYEIEANGKIIGTTAENTYAHSNINPANNNTYRVRALNGDLTGAWSDAAVSDKVTYISGGTISQNTVWSGGTYVVQGSVTVAQGVTLQVMQGTIVKFQPGNILNVAGKLDTQGTEEQPIVFTSEYDAEYGGSGVKGVYEKWCGINVTSTGEFIGDFVRIKNAGYPYRYYAFGSLEVNGAIDLKHSLIKDSNSYGIVIRTQKNVSIKNSIVENSASYGIYIEQAGSTTFSLDGNTIAGSKDYAINIDLGGITSSSVIPGISTNNTFVGNSRNYINLSGQMVIDLTLSRNVYKTYYTNIPVGRTLTIQPGTVLLYSPGDVLSVKGKLDALGTEDQPIVFTSEYDAKYGGSGVRGVYEKWRGINVTSTGEFIGDYVHLKNAGYPYLSLPTGALDVSGTIDLNHSLIKDSNSYGITIGTQKKVLIKNSVIENSGSHGIQIYNAGGTTFSLDGNTIAGSKDYPINIDLGGITSSSVFSGISTNNSFVGNSSNYINLSGQMVIDLTLSTNVYKTYYTNIPVGRTLTIQPGTVLLYSPGDVLSVKGKLDAQGTEDQPIVFTSEYDAEYGGSGVRGVYEKWRGINVTSTGEFIGDYVHLKNAGYPYLSLPTGALDISGTIDLNHSLIKDSNSYGITIGTQKKVFIKNSVVENSGSHGIQIYNAGGTNFSLDGNTIAGSKDYPINIDLGGIISSSVFSGIGTNNKYVGNRKNFINLNGQVTADLTLSENTYLIPYITILAGKTLSVQPGVKLIIDNSYFDLFGRLRVLGTQEKPVIMTTSYDKEYGGGGVTSYTHYWRGILVRQTGMLEAYHLKLKYATIGIEDSGGLTLVNSEITNCYSYGTFFNTAIQPTLLSNTFRDDPYGVYNNNPNITIDASYNYWNSIYGPSVQVRVYDPVYNSWNYQWVGVGTKIYGNVAYTPYLGAETMIALYFGKINGTYAPTGNYSKMFTDMSVSGPEDVNFTRTYNSQDTEETGVLGKGWTFSYEASITDYEDFENIKIVSLPDGSREAFSVEKDGSFTANNTRSKLEKLEDGSYLLTTREQIKYGFNSEGNLTRIESREGNCLSIQLASGGKPLRITDYAGREYQLTYQGGFLKSITNPAGRTVTYEYENGRLVKVIGPDGITSHYGYDAEGYLTEIRDGNNDRIEAVTYQTSGKTTRVNQVTDAHGNSKTYTYDNVNGKTTITDSKGISTTQWYDTTFNITNSTDGEGRLTTAVYTTQDGVNKYGEVKSTTDRNGNTTSYEYDSRGNIIKITNPDSSYKQYTYSGKNNITSERDETGKFTYYIYDETDTFLLKIVRPLNGTDNYSDEDQSKFAITEYNYYASGGKGHTVRGLVKSITDPEGNITTYTYDAYGNVATVTNPEGNQITYTNNILGLPTIILSPKGEETKISYNDNANPVEEVKAGDETTRFIYDNLGRKVQVLTPNLSQMISEPTESEGYRYTYYSSGNLHTVTDPEDNTTTYTYDLYGNMQTETRPDGSIYSYEYDSLNRVIKEYIQDSKTSERILQKSYTYSILSNKNTQTTETVYLNKTNTAVTVKVYDYAVRLTKQTNPDGGITVATYNSNGTLYSKTDALDKITYYRYDGLNRLTQQWTPFESGKYTYTAYIYDKNGNKLTENIGIEAVSLWGTPATQLTTAYEYDGNKLMTRKTDAAGGTTSYEYDVNGNLSREKADIDGLTYRETAYQYNHLGKVKTETWYAKSGDIYGNSFNSSGDTLLETIYTYDANGNVLTVTTPDGTTTAYEYDKLDRPVTMTVQGLDEYGHPVDITTYTAYDYAGNILSTTDANGNITQNIYNAKGLLIRRVDAKGGITLHDYDNAGRLTTTVSPENYVEGTDLSSMSRAVFTYDTMGRVILEQDIYYDKTVDAWNTINAKAYQYNKNGKILKELDALGYESGTGSTITERINTGYGTVNTYNDAGLLLTTQSPVTKEKGLSYDIRYTYDGAGRTITETNAKGVVTTHTYDNMGRVLKTSVQDGTAKTLRQVTYDLLGNILTETDGKGNTTTYTYNRLGLVKSMTTPGDATIPSNMTVYQYDELGRQVYQKDSLGKEIIVTYNYNGQVQTQTEQKEDGTQRITVSNAYDKNGNLRFATDANGVTTEQKYDALNRVVNTSVTVSGTEQTTTYTYDKNGNQLTVTDWLGNTYANNYDALNRLIKKTDPYGATVERYEYNNNHVQVKAVDALDNETTYAYDKNNRLLRTTDPEGNITSQTYDAVGNTATKTDGKGNVTAYEYDALNRLVKVTNAKSEITAYTYDLNRNMLTKKDGQNHTVTYTYNVANLLVTEADQTGAKESYVYYTDGKVRSKTDKNGSILTYLYDIHGNLLTETADGPGDTKDLEYNYTYDNKGNQLTTTDTTGTTRRTYDELGRVLIKTVPVIGTVTFTYDIRTGAGEGCYREKTTDPKGNITIKEYDKTGRLIKVIAGNDTVTYTYYDNGSRESVTYNNGTKEEYTYNANNQVKTLINRRADGSILDSYTYTYDSAGNQLTKKEIIAGIEKGTTTYTYDVLNRLLTVTEPGGRGTSYEYDKAGNRTKETVTVKDTAGSSITTINTYTYDTRNRLTEIGTRVNNVLTKTTGYTYDNNGNQLTTVVKNYANGTTVTSTIITLTNTYDLYNQLIRSITDNGTMVNNIYNAEGYRVGKESITGEGGREYTRYLYEADKVVLETGEAGDLKARNIYGTNLLIRITGSTAYQYLYNGHADVTALLTREGDIAATYYYDAFGNILESTGDVDNSILYAGYQYDEETGLYYLNARMYDPVTARFLQEDTYKGDPNDPLSLNLYTYCMNNPLVYYDPTGHMNLFIDDASGTGLDEDPFLSDLLKEHSNSAWYENDAKGFYQSQQYYLAWFYGSDAKERLDNTALSHSSYVVYSLETLRKQGKDLSELKMSDVDKMCIDLSKTFYKIDSIAIAVYSGYNLYKSSNSSQSGISDTKTKLNSKEGGSDTTRVGRWMSQAEYDKMVETGHVQMSGDNKVHVANPADIDAFGKQAPNGSIYVEFDVSSNTMSQGGTDGWGIINGPGSLLDRLYAKKGLPRITEMPKVNNIEIKGSK